MNRNKKTLEKLISDGQDILSKSDNMKINQYLSYFKIVDDKMFKKWYGQVKKFLTKNNCRPYIAKLHNGINKTNYDTCSEQVENLKELRSMFN